MREHLEKLNEKQLEAVTDTEGYVLVFAGAGSGKTRVLTSRIAHIIIEKKALPEEILAITFTNKAAEEMRERLFDMGLNIEKMWVSTIHSMCVRLLRNNIGRLQGYNSNFSIYSEIDKNNVLKRIIAKLGLKDEKYLKKSRFYISESKNRDENPQQFRQRTDIKDIATFANIYAMYDEELKSSNALDFDDLLVKTFHLLDEDEEILSYYSHKFKYVHIDEFQDTNAIQFDIAKLLCSYHHNLFAVGDDDQSIYGWRGADVRNILEFERVFKDAKIHKLEQNYRSTKRILSLANKIIAGNSDRKPKMLWTNNDEGEKVEVEIAESENKEAEYTAIKIKQMMSEGAKACDFAVLMRINALSRAYEQEFTKYGIPYKVFGGFKFFERKEIKDLIAYMRILVNPLDNESVLRIINVPRRGIGDKTIETLIGYAEEYGLSVFDGIVDCEKLPFSTSAKTRLIEFRKIITSLMVDCNTVSLSEIFNKVVVKTNFLSQFEVDSEENYSKRMNVDEFQNSIEDFAKSNKGATLSDFLNSITLSSDVDEMEEGNFVSIATIHAVKGLEFKNVFICGLDETFFPLARAEDTSEMEEERRLMYVAITRAREKLFLTRAINRFFHGERQYTAQSRFLTELADELGIYRLRRRNFSRSDGYGDSSYGGSSYGNSYGGSSYGGSSYGNSYGGSTYGGSSYGNSYGGSTYGSSSKRNSFIAPYGASDDNGYGGFSAGRKRNKYNSDDFGFEDKSESGTHRSPQKKQSNTFAITKEEKKPNSVAGFASGVKVRHAKFGEGIVIAIKGEGKNLIADVAFRGVGIKSLAVAFAPLEIIE